MKQIVFILIALLSIQSCEESNEPINDVILPIKNNFILTAGDTISDSLDYKKFNPAILVKGNRNGTSEHYGYIDSFLIDLNLDNIYDLKFLFFEDVYSPICDSLDEGCCMPQGYAYCNVTNLTNFDIACSYDSLSSIYRPSRLNLGDTIDENLQWIRFNKSIEFGLATYPTFWNTAEKNGFMAFRYLKENHYLCGWIRLNTNYCMEINIYDFAVKK